LTHARSRVGHKHLRARRQSSRAREAGGRRCRSRTCLT
jgi:hypothetical protein